MKDKNAPIPEGLQKGSVKWFDAKKGYGFISPGASSKGGDVFVHHSAIVGMTGYKQLFEGQFVEYEVVTGPKGSQAANVRVVTGE